VDRVEEVTNRVRLQGVQEYLDRVIMAEMVKIMDLVGLLGEVEDLESLVKISKVRDMLETVEMACIMEMYSVKSTVRMDGLLEGVEEALKVK
jgi:hypothetical protein